MGKTKGFDKYFYYSKSVQAPKEDAKFLGRVYRDVYNKKAETMREDFCAAFALSCAWVQGGAERKALGVDLDPEPLNYGRENYLPKLKPDQRSRVEVYEDNVLNASLPKVDIISAMNFSYMIFKTRANLLQYLETCHNNLKEQAVLVMDCFGGAGVMEPNIEETKHEDFSYFWEQDSYNPVTNEALFHIHFKRKGEKKRKRVFTYDWRLWSLAELKDLMLEAGFHKVSIYWEGTGADGDGNGIYRRTEKGDDSVAWVSYIVGSK